MSKDHLVSVVIPVFNGEKVIGRMIGDVLRQTERRVEVIIVDDGSADGTVNRVRDYSRKDKRVTLVTQANRGPSAARNTGIKKASGKYIMFFDADDRVDDVIVEKMLAQIEAEPAIDLVEAAAVVEYFDKSEEILSARVLRPIHAGKNHKEQILRSLLKSGLFHSIWNKIYKLDIIKSNKITFDESVKNGEDLIFNLQYLQYVNRYAVLEESYYHYRKEDGSQSITGRQKGAIKIFANRKAMYSSLRNYIKEEYPLLMLLVKMRWLTSSILTTLRSRWPV